MNDKEKIYVKNIIICIIILGIFIKNFLYLIVPDIKNAIASIVGYSLVLGSIFMLIFIQIENTPILKFLKEKIPYFLIVLLLSFYISLNIQFFDKINSKNLSQQYNLIEPLSSFMILLQLYFIHEYVNGKERFKTLSYVITPLNFALIGIMYINLRYFLTDG